MKYYKLYVCSRFHHYCIDINHIILLIQALFIIIPTKRTKTRNKTCNYLILLHIMITTCIYYSCKITFFSKIIYINVIACN